MSKRRSQQLQILILSFLILSVLVFGFTIKQDSLSIDFANKNIGPSAGHLFGFDSYGRDLFLRVAKGLYLSCSLALVAICISLCIVLIIVMILVANPSKKHLLIDKIIELFLSVPQMVLLILISVACGKGYLGVVLGIAFFSLGKASTIG